jgi:hypothetical protein
VELAGMTEVLVIIATESNSFCFLERVSGDQIGNHKGVDLNYWIALATAT